MKATLAVFLLALLFSTLAAAQNPYPTSCDNFSTETAYCSDVHPGAGCHGSLAGIIVASTGADGTSFAQPGTLILHRWHGELSRHEFTNLPYLSQCFRGIT